MIFLNFPLYLKNDKGYKNCADAMFNFTEKAHGRETMEHPVHSKFL